MVMRSAYGSASRSDLIPKEIWSTIDRLSKLQRPLFNKPRIMPWNALPDNGVRSNRRDECPVMKGLRQFSLSIFASCNSRDECPVMKGLRQNEVSFVQFGIGSRRMPCH